MGHGPDDLPSHLRRGGFRDVNDISSEDLDPSHPLYETPIEAQKRMENGQNGALLEEFEEDNLSVDERMKLFNAALIKAEHDRGYSIISSTEAREAQMRIEEALKTEQTFSDADLLAAGFDREAAGSLIKKLKMQMYNSEYRYYDSHGKRGRRKQ